MSADLTIIDPAEYKGEDTPIYPVRSPVWANELQPGELDCNWTYNLTAMQVAGIDTTLHQGSPDAAAFIHRLRHLIAAFEAAPAAYRALNPENGWGDYDRFLAVLHTIRAWLTGRDLQHLEMRWWL